MLSTRTPARVLLLPHGDQGVVIGTLDPNEDTDEVGRSHRLQEVRIVGQIDRGLGRELKRIVVLLEPCPQVDEQRSHGLLVADEIVVDEVDVAAIAEPIERLQLRQHLRVGLGARHPPVKLDNVAKLAVERTTPRKLHADVEVMIELQ